MNNRIFYGSLIYLLIGVAFSMFIMFCAYILTKSGDKDKIVQGVSQSLGREVDYNTLIERTLNISTGKLINMILSWPFIILIYITLKINRRNEKEK